MNKSLVLLASLAFPFSWAFGDVVINEIYGGGGKSSAPFDQDFVELFNNGTDAVDISGFQLEYAKPGRSLRTIAMIPASTILGAGEFYLIGGASGPVGVRLPHVDFTSFINLKVTGGKIGLLDSSSSLCDKVDYGAAAFARLHIAEIVSRSNTMSNQRMPNGTDTNDNNLDFQAQIPTPDAMNAAVPEPSTWMMLGVGAALLAGARRFRRRQS